MHTNNPAIIALGGLEFQIADTRWYVPTDTLSTENNKKLIEQLKSGFKRTVKRSKSQMAVPSNNNNWNYLNDLTFTKVNG